MDRVIAANYLVNLEKCLEQFGVFQFLSKIGIDSVRVHDPLAYLSMAEFKQVITSAYSLSNCPYLGLVFGQSLSIVNHGFLGYAAMSSPTLGTAIQTTLSYLNTRTSLLSLELHQAANQKRAYIQIISLTEDPVISRFMTELAIIHFMKMRSFLINSSIPCPRIDINYAKPDYADFYEQVFQTEVVFDAQCSRVWIEAEELYAPINFADDVSYQLAKNQLQEIAKNLTSKEDLISKIKTIVLNHSLNHLSMEEIASKLCMTSRTLRRHLQKLQVTYQELLDEVREQKAKTFLLNNGISITEVSFLLGFNDTSSFTKAFKRWTGLTPSEYKEQHGIS
ncbi:AraC family transcriptional regulator [Legionella bononiensis]|uniref:AraC family transcriptional regulator n=1 Tax=Legionella bononiensis TaxID=2793102 RepID=A0ABS1WE64_9GAMM|nr:AraC family transcriptional regulator [Legionella bononiensis]MBL7527647.1 AraC family transcriptional regulator [Legionella bononiensis]